MADSPALPGRSTGSLMAASRTGRVVRTVLAEADFDLPASRPASGFQKDPRTRKTETRCHRNGGYPLILLSARA